MTTRYVGLGGNDGNSGLTWALRKLTLNGVEDTPVVASDVIYVGPGVYREQLTCDVSGGVGNWITYIADITGEHTDGVGGVVRVTGSNNDQTAVRTYCILGSSDIDYRVFRGFHFDLSSSFGVSLQWDNDYWIIEDCAFSSCGDNSIAVNSAETASYITIRRCIFSSAGNKHIYFDGSDDTSNCLVENCIFLPTGGWRYGIETAYGGVTIRNCFFTGFYIAIYLANAIVTTVPVNNCIFYANITALEAQVVGDIVEDFNTFWQSATDRTNVNVGANSEIYPPLLAWPILHSGVSQVSGFKFPWWFGELSEWSTIQAITGSNEPTEEFRGIARPVTASKNSWGPCQFFDMERETGTVRTGSVSIVLHDAGRHQIWVPVTATSTTIKVYVYREANYAGLLPQMIIKQPGVADRITTDVGAVGGWNLLTDTFVPAALPPYVVVELVSRNTNGVADETFFDDLDVS